MSTIRVIVADDHAILRAGLKTAIDNQIDMTVVGEAGDCQEALDKTRELKPDILSLDLSMPGNRSIAMIEEIRTDCPDTKVLVLTMHGDVSYARTALAEGCSGYVVKTTGLTEYLEAIRVISRGNTYIDSGLAEELNKATTGNKRNKPNQTASETKAKLSKREMEVLILLAQGQSYQNIAGTLFIGTKTIETYRRRLSTKLGLRTRADIVRFALENGLIGPTGSNALDVTVDSKEEK